MTDLDLDAAPRRARLPDAALPPLAGGPPVPLRANRHAAVVVLLDGAPDARGAEYLRALADAEPALAGWDGRVLVVVSGPDAAAAAAADGAADGAFGAAFGALRLPFPVVGDAAGSVAAGAVVAPPAVVVADQWGEVHWSAAVGPGREWPAPAELEQWLRFLAVRCAG